MFFMGHINNVNTEIITLPIFADDLVISYPNFSLSWPTKNFNQNLSIAESSLVSSFLDLKLELVFGNSFISLAGSFKWRKPVPRFGWALF